MGSGAGEPDHQPPAPDGEAPEPPGPDVEALLRQAPRALLYLVTALAFATLVILWMLWMSPAWL